jgi:hypothetical protein
VVDLPSEDPTATFETDADVVVMALAQRASVTPSWSTLARRTAD